MLRFRQLGTGCSNRLERALINSDRIGKITPTEKNLSGFIFVFFGSFFALTGRRGRRPLQERSNFLRRRSLFVLAFCGMQGGGAMGFTALPKCNEPCRGRWAGAVDAPAQRRQREYRPPLRSGCHGKASYRTEAAAASFWGSWPCGRHLSS